MGTAIIWCMPSVKWNVVFLATPRSWTVPSQSNQIQREESQARSVKKMKPEFCHRIPDQFKWILKARRKLSATFLCLLELYRKHNRARAKIAWKTEWLFKTVINSNQCFVLAGDVYTMLDTTLGTNVHLWLFTNTWNKESREIQPSRAQPLLPPHLQC